MTQKVNINGQEIELEQCVINGDELEYTDLEPGQFIKDFEDSNDIVDIPEDEQFIKEYIESNLDSQPDDELEYKYLIGIDKQKFDEMPSSMTFDDWLSTISTLDLCQNTEHIENLWKQYRENYRKELREWWFKRKQKNEESN